VSVTRLTETSYVVLGLIERLQPATPYDLKRAAEAGVDYFWALPHTQLYSECARLAEAGLLDEKREETGRRRRIYRLTAAGRRALREWLDDTEVRRYELRDPGLLKLAFGADPKRLADAQIAEHERMLAAFEEMLERAGEAPERMLLALKSGIGHEREYLRYWRRIADGKDPA
jgi:PadR family transcriptional regulator, regulatory protein AphA